MASFEQLEFIDHAADLVVKMGVITRAMLEEAIVQQGVARDQAHSLADRCLWDWEMNVLEFYAYWVKSYSPFASEVKRAIFALVFQ